MKDYKEYFIIKAPPEEIYAALTNPISIMAWTGDKVEMSTESGSEFSLWDGSIEGKNIEFEQDRKIVQQWYFGDQEEESIVTILLHPHKKGTSVELRHTNIPGEDFDDLVEGWEDSYFGELRNYFEE